MEFFLVISTYERPQPWNVWGNKSALKRNHHTSIHVCSIEYDFLSLFHSGILNCESIGDIPNRREQCNTSSSQLTDQFKFEEYRHVVTEHNKLPMYFDCQNTHKN